VARYARTVSRGKVVGDRLEALYGAARETIALPSAPEERRLEIQGLLARWALVRAQQAEVDRRLAALLQPLAAAQALLTVPEVNAVCAGTLLAELGTPADYVHPRQVLKLAGMNLIERSSGDVTGRKRVEARPADAPAPAVPARGAVVSPVGPLPGLLRGAPRAQWESPDQGHLCRGPEARANVADGAPDGGAVRPRSLAGQSPSGRALSLSRAWRQPRDRIVS
jgi:hypothetical protein